MIMVFGLTAALFYIGASSLVVKHWLGNSGRGSHLGMLLAGVAVLCHFAAIAVEAWMAPAQSMSLVNVLSLVAMLISATMLVTSRYLPNKVLLPVVFVFSAIVSVVALIVPSKALLMEHMSAGLVIHIVLSLFSYGILVMAFLHALQMSFITYRLKHKQAALMSSPLPPLTLVESILFKLVLLGTALLAVSLATGFTFLDDMLSKQYAHKTVLSFIALFLYVLLLLGQKLWGWRGRQVITLTSVGMVILTLAYFGSRFVREFILA